MRNRLITFLFLFAVLAVGGFGQGTAFTYQGQLQSSSTPVSGNFDFEFALFDADPGGTQIGSTLTRSGILVTSGVFSVRLDFGSGFPGASRYLEIRVRPSSGGTFTTLLPRQSITSSPYAIKSLTSESATVAVNAVTANNATTANNALALGGVNADQFVVTTDPRMNNARPPTTGSTNYVQNTTTPQASTNFNISGVGNAASFSATFVNASSGYRINGVAMLRGSDVNIFVGNGAGLNNSTGGNNSFYGTLSGFNNSSGSDNSFFGESAGRNNSTASRNSFFGKAAGLSNTTGLDNSFFGFDAGRTNTEGRDNSFFGVSSGKFNNTGILNAFFGIRSGQANTIGSYNAFFGSVAGLNNTTGFSNVFVGNNSGFENTAGSRNVFVGMEAGLNNETGDDNVFVGSLAGWNNVGGTKITAIGNGANVDAGSRLSYATAIGADARVSTNNTIFLGRPNGQDTVITGGQLEIHNYAAGGNGQVCRIQASGIIALCASSLRYKTNLKHFSSGIDLIRRLRPITFDWKSDGMHDLGLGAEDVAAIEPLLVTYDKSGEVQGVKYDRVGVVLINAVKEQQTQIERQKAQIEALTKYICERDRTAAFCTP